MKTQWKRKVVFPLVSLAFMLTFLYPARASIWFQETLAVCDVQVQVQDNGGYWRWVTVQGINKDCVPASLSLCQVTQCAPIPYVQR